MKELTSFIDYDISKIPQYGKQLDSIFQYNHDIEKNAYLNWRMGFRHNLREQFVVVGEAFFETAFNLLQHCLEDNSDKKADSWIFPIMFNTVHGIEVYLKAINAALSVILNKQRGITAGGHDLKCLFSVARALIIEYKTKNKNDATEQMFLGIKVVGKFIENIYEKTDDMTFARYPLTKNKQGHFYIQTFDNEVIDMELLEEQIIYVFEMLKYIYDTPELDIDSQEDAMMDCY